MRWCIHVINYSLEKLEETPLPEHIFEDIEKPELNSLSIEHIYHNYFKDEHGTEEGKVICLNQLNIETVSLSHNWIDFGACSRLKDSGSITISVFNNTLGKVTCVWAVPGESTGG